MDIFNRALDIFIKSQGIPKIVPACGVQKVVPESTVKYIVENIPAMREHLNQLMLFLNQVDTLLSDD